MKPKNGQKQILFLAQLPPPFHGQSQIAGAVHDVFSNDAGANVWHLWRGGARAATEVGKRSLVKYFGFGLLVITLITYLIRGKRFDVVYLGFAPWAHTVTRDAALMILSKLLSKRVWIHVHGDGLQNFIKPKDTKSRFVAWALRQTELLAITENTFESGQIFGQFSEVTHLPNFAPDPGNPKPRGKKPIHLGIVSNLDPRKGTFEFLSSISRMKSQGMKVRGTIVGGPTASLSVEKLREKVEELGLSKVVNVTGRVSEEEKHRLLSEMDIFLYPSRHDLAPLALIEAIAHGCIPIVFEVGGIPEITGKNLSHNVLQPELTEEEFAREVCNIIKSYVKNPKLRTKDAANARKQFEANYSEAGFRNNILSALQQKQSSINSESVYSTKIAGQET